MSSFPILMYHAIVPCVAASADRKRMLEQDKLLSDPGAWRYALEEPVFLRQMQFLDRAGIPTHVDLGHLADKVAQPAVCVTFDDGHRSNYELGFPILMKYRQRAIFFVTTDWIGHPDFMSENQLRELRASGMLIGSHGCSHTFFSEMSPAALRRELADSKARLEAILGQPVRAISLPGGRSQPRIREFAREAGYEQLFTSTVALADSAGDPLDWPRLPITNNLSEKFIFRLLQGDPSAVARLARAAWLRRMLRRLIGK